METEEIKELEEKELEEGEDSVFNRYKVTGPLIIKWSLYVDFDKKVNVVLFALWCVVLACGVSSIALNLINNGDKRNLYFAIAYSLLALYKLLIGRVLRGVKRYLHDARMYKSKEWWRTTVILENSLLIIEESDKKYAKLEYAYKDIVKIEIKKKYIMVFFDNFATRLYKNAFSDCVTWEDCVKFFAAVMLESKGLL